jgi:hypothetical protein
VADPWTEDLAALGERSRHQLRSIAATRASVTPKLQETKMRLFKTHPTLATALVLVFVAFLGGAAYAFVDRVILSVDPDKSATEIEHNVQQQLDNAGIPATAHADKSDGRVQVSIETHDPSVGGKIDVAVPDGGQQMRIEVLRALSADETAQFAAFEAELEKLPDGLSDAQLQDTLTRSLASHGFTTGVTVTVANGSVTVSIR